MENQTMRIYEIIFWDQPAEENGSDYRLDLTPAPFRDDLNESRNRLHQKWLGQAFLEPEGIGRSDFWTSAARR
jgi:hypothetical protein